MKGFGVTGVGTKAKTTIEAIARAKTTLTNKALTLGLDHIRDLLIPRDFFLLRLFIKSEPSWVEMIGGWFSDFLGLGFGESHE
jgi:hypothetical protein